MGCDGDLEACYWGELAEGDILVGRVKVFLVISSELKAIGDFTYVSVRLIVIHSQVVHQHVGKFLESSYKPDILCPWDRLVRS